MFTFAAGLYDSWFKEPERFILIVGPAAAGKTTLLEQLKVMYSPTHPSTVAAEAVVPAARPAAAGATSSPADGLSSLRQQLRDKSEGGAADGKSAGNKSNRTESETKAPLPPPNPAPAKRTVKTPSGADVAKATRRDRAAATNALLEAGSSPPRRPSSAAGESAAAPAVPPAPALVSSSPPLSPPPPPAVPRSPRLPGTALPATAEALREKHIAPTVGLNYTRLRHYFSPPPRNANDPRLGEAAPLAPNPARTLLTVWDLGGQASLQSLWPNYFAASQAVVFVVDSTAPFVLDAASPAAAAAAAAPPSVSAAEAAQLYAPQRRKLSELVHDPRLRGAVFLVLCSKADRSPRLSLAQMQEALGIADLALDGAFYTPDGSAGGDDAAAGGGGGGGGGAAPVVPPEGSGGFGLLRLRLAEVSSINGYGIAEAMDWLVSQLLQGARHVQLADS